MHFDIAHAAVAAILIYLVVWLIRRTDPADMHRKWDWRIFFGVFFVMAGLNIIWPYGP